MANNFKLSIVILLCFNYVSSDLHRIVKRAVIQHPDCPLGYIWRSKSCIDRKTIDNEYEDIPTTVDTYKTTSEDKSTYSNPTVTHPSINTKSTVSAGTSYMTTEGIKTENTVKSSTSSNRNDSGNNDYSTTPISTTTNVNKETKPVEIDQNTQKTYDNSNETTLSTTKSFEINTEATTTVLVVSKEIHEQSTDKPFSNETKNGTNDVSHHDTTVSNSTENETTVSNEKHVTNAVENGDNKTEEDDTNSNNSQNNGWLVFGFLSLSVVFVALCTGVCIFIRHYCKSTSEYKLVRTVTAETTLDNVLINSEDDRDDH